MLCVSHGQCRLGGTQAGPQDVFTGGAVISGSHVAPEGIHVVPSFVEEFSQIGVSHPDAFFDQIGFVSSQFPLELLLLLLRFAIRRFDPFAVDLEFLPTAFVGLTDEVHVARGVGSCTCFFEGQPERFLLVPSTYEMCHVRDSLHLGCTGVPRRQGLSDARPRIVSAFQDIEARLGRLLRPSKRAHLDVQCVVFHRHAPAPSSPHDATRPATQPTKR
mmetsp:Transcript_8062/g.49801  ORF Transcript_8062/g.49801 Transcript_8062/m.49801 type:complete len:217 (-) Transcript_8062:476-1126(-)